MKRLATALALSTMLLTTGCATMFGGGSSQLHVDIDEPRQDVEVLILGTNGETITKRSTDFQVSLSRGADYVIKVRSPQYETQEVTLRRNLRGTVWANGLLLLLGVVPGLIGFGVDFATNNAWEHEKRSVNVRLQKERRSTMGQYSVLPILLTDDHGHEQMLLEAPILR